MADRGWRDPAYVLLTPDNRYASRLAAMPGVTVVKLVTPRMAPSRLGQYLLDIAPGGGTAAPIDPGFEHFLFGLDGEAVLTTGGGARPLGAGHFAYLPDDLSFELAGAGRLLWLKRCAAATATTSRRRPPRSPASRARSCSIPGTRRSTST